MEASIKDHNIKNFVRLLQCASRFGDDLNMHANKDAWELAVTNANKSAFCLIKLKPKFFSRYRSLGDTPTERRRGVKCQLLVKSVLAVLGKASSMATVERLDLTIVDPDSSLRKRRKREKSRSETKTPRDEDDYDHSEDEAVGGIEAKLIMKLVCKHGVVKKHSLHLGTSEFLRAEVDPDTTPSTFTVSARALRDMLDHFSLAAPGFQANSGYRGENQLGWMFAHHEIRVKSWETTQSNLCTEIKVDPAEFDYYWLENNARVDLTLPMKEFRAALTLAEQLGIRLAIAYSVPAQPLTITSAPDDDEQNDASDLKYEVFCAIATTPCEAFADVVERKPSTSAAGSSVARGSASVSNSHSTPQVNASGKRKRTTLSMSSERAGGYVTVIRNSVVEDTTSGEGDTEPLFLSNSQEAPGSQMNGSQRIRMSQQEALEMAGLGDMDEDELMGAMEAGEEEDMQEEEERERRQILAAQGGAELDGTLAGISSIRGGPGRGEAEISGLDFEPDSDIFGGDADETMPIQARPYQQSQGPRDRQPSPRKQPSPQRQPSPQNQPSPQTQPSQIIPVKKNESSQRVVDEEELEEEGFAQTQLPKDRSYQSFFED